VGKVTAADTEKYHRVLKETYVPMSESYRRKMGIPASPDMRAERREEKTSSGSTSEFRPVAFHETRGLAFAEE